MLASLVGKYVRELLMTRISAYYDLRDSEGEPLHVSGYNDPRTKHFIQLSAARRQARAIPRHCFERARDEPTP
jgi:hypothetical protein